MNIVNLPKWINLEIFWPPTLILRQFMSILYFKHLIKWDRFGKWLLRHSFKSIPVAAGALGMGCIGFPAHPAWEVTSACNLNCIHCHAAGGKPSKDELTTYEAKKLIDELAKIDEFKMLVYTGGEPLLRADIFELLNHSKAAGLTNVIATNGTLITEEVAFKLKEAGVVGVAISLDSVIPDIHNKIRANPKAFNLALRGIKAVKAAGILLQINTTAMEYNYESLNELVDFSDRLGSGIMLMYQLVPVGRGNAIEPATLKKNKNEKLLRFLAQKQKSISTIIEPVAGPQYWPYLMKKRGYQDGIWKKLAEKLFHGCTAGRGFVYIKSNGDVWPCPFIEISAGNVKDRPFDIIWKDSEIFLKLRDRENTLKGRCGRCEFRKICGGCRGRALAYNNDYLAEDPSCFLDS